MLMNRTGTPDRMPTGARSRRPYAVECDQFFKTELEDVKVVVEFEMIREHELPLRRLDVRVLIQPGADGEEHGSCGISLLYNLASQRIENVYACSNNLDARRIPDLLQAHLRDLQGLDQRYHPFYDPLCRGCVIEQDSQPDTCSNPN